MVPLLLMVVETKFKNRGHKRRKRYGTMHSKVGVELEKKEEKKEELNELKGEH